MDPRPINRLAEITGLLKVNRLKSEAFKLNSPVHKHREGKQARNGINCFQ